MLPLYGYAKKGLKFSLPKLPKSYNISMIAVFTYEEIIGI